MVTMIRSAIQRIFPKPLHQTPIGQEFAKTLITGRQTIKEVADRLNDYKFLNGHPVERLHSYGKIHGWMQIDKGWKARQVFLHTTPEEEKDRLNVFVKEGQEGAVLTPHRHHQKEHLVVIRGTVERLETGEIFHANGGLITVAPMELVGLRAVSEAIILVIFVPPLSVVDISMRNCSVIQSIIYQDPQLLDMTKCKKCSGGKCPMGVTEENKGLWLTYAGLSTDEQGP